MAEPVLVADLGCHATKAALLAGGPATMLRDPHTGEDWPGLPGPRSTATSVESLLAALRAEALRAADRVSWGRVDRLALSQPPSYPDTADLISAGEAAGFHYVELVSPVEAAVLDQLGRQVMVHDVPRPAFGPGDLVLVCDLGENWTAALCRVTGDGVTCVGQETASSGRDLDARLLDDLRTQLADWVEPALAAPGEPGVRAHHEAMEFLRRLKHSLSEAEEAVDHLAAGFPPYRLSAAWLARLAEPGLRWLAASSRSLLARASTSSATMGGGGVAPNSTLADVAVVLLVGGGARLPLADAVLQNVLGRPVLVAAEPEYAVLRGATRWAAASSGRRLVAEHPRWRVEPLSWSVPGNGARLETWADEVGTPYRRGAVLARVRTVDDQVYELTAPSDGVLLEQPVAVGDLVGPTLVAPAKRRSSASAGDPPGRLQRLSATGEWLLTPDRQFLVECASTARHVKLWSIPDGRLVNEFVPRLSGSDGYRGRVFMSPQGRLSLVAWDPAGVFSVWDVWANRRLAAFRDSRAPESVLVNESQWRLTVEGEDGGSAGRYRRTVASVWDLFTGTRVERITDDIQRRLAGYQPRSMVDGFGERAVSPDGTLHAVGLRTPSGATALALQESTSDSEVFREEYPRSSRVRMAFSADGRFLLGNSESGLHSQVDVWEL